MKIDPRIKEELKQFLLQKTSSDSKPRVVIRASYILSDQEIADLSAKIPLLKNAHIIPKSDPSILGGFMIEFGSSIIDLTLNSELQSLAQTLYETA